MKKVALLALVSAFMLVAANGRCESTITGSKGNGPEAERHAHRAALIAARRANPSAESESTRKAATGESKASKFWKNEAERSGVSGWKAPAINPTGWFKEQDRKYKERKTATK